MGGSDSGVRFCPGLRWEERVDLVLTLLVEVKGQKCTRRGVGSRFGAWIQWAVAAGTAEEPGDTWALGDQQERNQRHGIPNPEWPS